MTTQVEKTITVDLPVSRVYNQWTQFEEFPEFMGGVQNVQQVATAGATDAGAVFFEDLGGDQGKAGLSGKVVAGAAAAVGLAAAAAAASGGGDDEGRAPGTVQA